MLIMFTDRQRGALELFFKIIADQLTNLGITINDEISGFEFEIPITQNVVKMKLWKPIQLILFDTSSSSDLDTHKINIIIDVFIKYFGQKGIGIEFPSFENLMKHDD